MNLSIDMYYLLLIVYYADKFKYFLLN
ncbi:hypothetical protein AGR8A_Cc60061 [Agrobacterium fabrum str. J-07]|nr:hypothetical protein AGR8A_Cc60061 [Agrobacterium fabrum str. J-07]